MREPYRRFWLWTFLGAAAVAVVFAATVWVYLPLARWQQQRKAASRMDAHLPLIRRYAHKNALPMDLVFDVILAESSGRPRAVSPKNAKGLMQIMPAAETDVLKASGQPKGDLFDPEYNISIGTAYLRMLAERFDGEPYLVLAAYHAGPTRVSRLRQMHPEVPSRDLINRYAGAATQLYCRKILSSKKLCLYTHTSSTSQPLLLPSQPSAASSQPAVPLPLPLDQSSHP
ncbi:MAG: lytic transglycosylase domain-containing protein, partial [Phycisphaerae bacterium]|nr:lytic transglycosylase domain-containing protein [Phycisphaerae bacterium]